MRRRQYLAVLLAKTRSVYFSQQKLFLIVPGMFLVVARSSNYPFPVLLFRRQEVSTRDNCSAQKCLFMVKHALGVVATAVAVAMSIRWWVKAF